MSSPTEQAAVPVATGETTFIGFSRLPAEIRLMIWEQFVRTPRIIDITMPDNDVEVDRRFTIKIDGTLREQACPLLRVSHESRSVALKASLLLFSIQYPLHRQPQNHTVIVYRHFSIRSCDVVCLDGNDISFYKMTVEGETDKIANLIINMEACYLSTTKLLWGWVISGTINITRKLRNEQSLKTIYCLIRDPRIKPRRRHFELDDLRDLAPSQFPLYEHGIAGWLSRFLELPESLYEWRHYPQHRKSISAVLQRWKNMSLG